MRVLLVFCALAAAAVPQGEGHRQANETYLGLVVAEEGGKVVIREVLKGSPAAKAKAKPGDVVLRVGAVEIKRHNDVDAGMRGFKPGAKVLLKVQRGKEQLTLSPKAARPKVERTARGKTGFKAPAWTAFAWVNEPEGKEPPTLANSKGKIVVFHCFQAW
ncbi:MAG: PDZ domain-containing protein [Planctomycetota bacterium]|jgi:C-terminal processing protease CtpA/Prc